MFTIYDKTGNDVRLEIASLTYNGDFMGESFVSFDVDTPYPIDFEIGDYLEYRGERFVLNYTPSTIKNSSRLSSGNAFSYKDVKFNSLADELTRCDFLDYVLADNHVHFSGLSKFSFHVVSVKDLADRIQANLDRVYTGSNKWTVTVEDNVTANDKMITVDNINCWEALTLANSELDENFIIKGRVIKIGTEGLSVGKVLGYGKGNGLIKMEQSTNNDSLVVTRLRAFGSTRNIPYRYYNKLKDADGNLLLPESMYVPNLVLPGFAEAGGDAYVDSDNITSIGVREATVYFDGSGELQEIFPSIEGMTAEELKAAGKNVNATGRIDEIVSAEQMTDDGVVPEGKDELEKKTFTITLKDVGFNPVDDEHLTTETPYISIKSGWCGSRDFEITACEKKGDNYVLTCNREMDNSINKAFPNNPYQVSAGDYFVFIGIAMDDLYVKAASQRLLEAAKKYLAENDKSKYTYTPRIDNVFMARNPSIAMALKEGNILDFNDTDLGINASVIIQSVIIKEGGAVPEYEITLFNDKILSTIEKIQNSISSLANSTGITLEQAKSLFAAWIEVWRVKWFDQKLHTYDPVEFKSVTSNDFESKLKGWVIDALGNAEFRDVLLRSFKSWNFAAGPLGAGVGMVNDDELQTDKLLVRKIMYVLEMMIQRMRFQGGQMVLSPAAGFKVNSVEVFDTYYRLRCHPGDFNEFEVNDQARIQNFNGSDTKYLWSLVVAKGDDYIDISRVDKDGDGVPAEGDEIVQLGNRTNTNRQDAVLLSAVNGEVGIFTYFGINSFDLSGKEGSWFGKHGDKKGAVIKGEVHITAGSDGLDKFNEYEDIDERIQNAQDSANSVQEVVNNLTSIIIPDLQEQIDGSIMSWEGTVAPTMENEPAVNWTTEEERKRHLGDYYDYFLTVNEEQVTERYKFSKVNGTYQWVRVADSGSALAVSEARKALGLAGSKSAIIWSNSLPTPPYSINDMWVKEDGSMYICNTGRLEGETGSQTDWQLFNDTMLRLSRMADDNIITKEEKASIRDTWNQIQKEFASYQAQATTYGVSITALQNAYNTLNTFLTSTVKIASDEDTTLSVAQKTEYNQDFANYYSERTAFANVIAQKVADESVGNLQIGMVNLLKGSNVELNKQAYNLGYYGYDNKPEAGKTYTLVCCYTLGDSNTYIGAYSSNGGYHVGNLSKKGTRVVESITFTAKVTPTGNFDFYQFPNGTFGSTVHWAVLVEGNKGPNAWIPSLSEQGEAAAKNEVNNLQIGGINLANYSGGNFLDVLGLYSEDGQYASKATIDGKTCLQFNKIIGSYSGNCRFAPVTVENDEYTFSIWVKGSEEYDAQVIHYNGSNYGATTVHVTTSWERKVITFTAKAGTDVIHWGTKNTIYIADWKYEKGNKATDWSPSIADQNRYATEQGEAAVDNLQIGAVNLAINSSYANNAEGWKSWADKPFVVNDNILTTSQINGRSEIVICPPFDMHSGIEYTISAEVRSDTITSLNYNYVIGSKWGGNNQKIGDVAINTEWNRVKITFKAELTQKAGVGFGFLGTGTIQIRKFKIEIGNKATDWSPAPGDVQKEIEQSSTITKDDFAKEMGYESFQDMADKAVEKGGKLVVDGLLNANLIDVETLAANNAFINKLSTNILKAGSITADMLSVAGFTFENNNIYGGSKFGEGAGVNIVSDTSERAFKAYKDENNFVSMFYNSDNDWGLVGKVGGAELLKLGTESIISGWKIKTTGFEGGSFEYPTYSGSSGNYVISGGKGSKLFPDGGIMLIPTGTGILQPSSGLMQAGLIKAEGTNAMITGLEVIAHRTGTDGTFAQVTALKLSAKNDYSNPKYTPIAIEITSGNINLSNGILNLSGGASEIAKPNAWTYSSSGTIPTANRRLVYVSGNTGSDNPCYLSKTGAVDGQVITIINTNTSHRLNIKGTAMGDHWIREGCCGTFRYLAGYGLWYPERFS